MKKKLFILPLLGIFLYIILSSYSSGPGFSGIYGPTVGCGGGGCHGSSATSSTTVSMQLLNASLTPITTYVAGGSYFVRITGTQTSSSFTLPKFGFQIAAVNSSSATAGNLSAVSGTHTVTVTGIKMVEHGPAITATSGTGGAGTSYVVTVPWVAPASGTGTVTLRGTVNAVDGGGGADAGDKWNSGSSTAAELTAITGTLSTCIGASVTLSSTPASGTWTSSSPSTASVGLSTGVVTGASAGTATITYNNGGNFVTAVVTVSAAPGSFGGTHTVCASQTTTLTNTTSGGTWTSGTTSVATVVSGTGVVTGVAGGTAVLTYAIGTCSATTTVTVNPLAANTGSATACTGATTLLSNVNPGGTWTSSTPATGTVSTTGLVAGIASGTTNISYTLPTGCLSVTTVTVNTSPAAIGGSLSMCIGLSATATDVAAGGTWSSTSGSGTVSIVAATGVMTGVGAGTANITYTMPGGCFAVAVATVNPLPSPILGTTTICANESTTLTSFTSGGTWTSGSTAIATVDASTGVVTPATASGGTVTISYILTTGCLRTTTININPISPISGTLTICPGSTSALTCSPGGGTWSSGSTSVATVGGTGIVTGVATGTAVISYVASSGCFSMAIVTVSTTGSLTSPGAACTGSTVAITGGLPGGTWSSSTPAVGTISTTGVFNCLSAGTSTIVFTSSTGCTSSTIITVNATPGAVTGTGGGTFCINATIGASGGTGGTIYYQGTTSGGTSTATASSSQVVTSGGTYYFRSLSSAGCWGPEGSVSVTINPAPTAITGTAIVCVGSTTTLGSTPGGGTWASSNPAIATVISGTGSVTGISTGIATITYTNATTGCFTTRDVTVTATPAAVTVSGSGTFCGSTTITATGGSGGTIYFQGTTSGGVSTSTAATSQSVTSTGTYYFRSLSAGGCWGPEGSVAVTINPLPSAITGTAVICAGSTTTLSSTTSGGTWTSSNTTVATVNSSGLVSGLSSGTSTIVYTIGTGCTTSRVVTVNALPAAISGSLTLCVGGTTVLSSATSGGTWSSGTPAVATVNSATGVVTGIASGTAGITYTIATGCIRTAIVTVNSLPPSITGSGTVCIGSTITLANSATGGTWGSLSTTVSVGTTTGIVTGITTGTATVTYTLPTGCFAVATVTVNALPAAIAGTLLVCIGSTTIVTSSTPGGTWASSTPAIAIISASGSVTGITTGTSTISYTLTTGCRQTAVVTVNPVPTTISGTPNTCVGSTTTLTSTPTGGSWASSNTSIATVGAATGVVLGITAGTAQITYTIGTGCIAVTPVTINPAPTAGTISGSASVCTGLTITLSSTVSGGTWSSGTPAVATIDAAGVVTGVAAGTTIITYTVSGSCGTVTSTFNVAATTSASAGTLSGPSTVCLGASATLASTVTGGTWVSSLPAIASVGFTTGIVTGASIGTANITYTISSSCGTATAIRTITVNALPPAIAGTSVACVATSTTLTNTATGGTWSSANITIATVTSTGGVVTGISGGTTTITYTATTGCFATRSVSINALPALIGGPLELCAGSTTTLTNSSGAGTWASSNTIVALIGSATGSLITISGGLTNISFTLAATGCVRTQVLTVNPNPASITGATAICLGASSTLANTTTGGSWTSSNITVATIGATTGVVNTLAAGTTSISYTLGTGCNRSLTLTVNALPAAISGTAVVCVGGTTTLTDATSGGTWATSDGTIATIDATTGVVSGIAAGVATITYTATTGCFRTLNVAVNPLPAAISGTTSMCIGASETLASSTAGGVWISGSTGIATVSAFGVVTGIAPGTAAISYVLGTSCFRSTIVTINALPSAIAGSLTVCIGSITTITSSPSGGTWSSSTPLAATIDASTGAATGIAAGTSSITYTLPTGCKRTATLTVNALPSPISGVLALCVGSTTPLSTTSTGGTWTSGSTSIATISVPGIVSGISGGTTNITYILPTGCLTAAEVTVNALPAAISGTASTCVGATSTLTSTSVGGLWSIGTPTVAAIDAVTGVVTGIAAGTTAITYTLPTGCITTATFTVNPLPVAGTVSGTAIVCVAATSSLSATISGGIWSNTTGKATVSSSGVMTGVAAGLDTVKYSVSNVCGTATVSYPVTVNPLPVAGIITGGSDLCVSLTATFTPTVSGGSWSSGSATLASISTTGVVTGVAPGTATISYTVTNSCGAATVTANIIVHALADPGIISGADSVCPADTIHLSNTVSGGTWISTNTAVATVNASGIVTGIAPGAAIIRYRVTNVCSDDSASHPVVVKTPAACLTSVPPIRENGIANIRLFPNPTNGKLNIESPVTGTLTIYTIDGKEVSSYESKSTVSSIDLPQGLSAGVYMCRFSGVDGSTAIIRLIYQP